MHSNALAAILWGPTFGWLHILTLVIGAGIIFGLYFALRKTSEKCQTITLGILSFSGICAILYNLLKWNSPLEYLPFHMCSINAVLLPITVFTRKKVLGNLLILWCVGALLALLFNQMQNDYELFSMTFLIYYLPHVLEFGIPILLFAFKLIKADIRCILSTLLITIAIYTAVHLFNLWLNGYCLRHNILDYAGNVIQVNYMYSIKPEVPIMSLMYSVIPHSYWYMYVSFPFIALILASIYLPSILLKKRKEKQAQNAQAPFSDKE